jgi:hypothetical protein
MEAFEPTPPEWTQFAVHAREFCCPACRSSSKAAQSVWINRRSPVYIDEGTGPAMGRRRKWQEFYHCECSQVWWAWSNDRPPSELAQQERELPPPRLINPWDD